MEHDVPSQTQSQPGCTESGKFVFRQGVGGCSVEASVQGYGQSGWETTSPVSQPERSQWHDTSNEDDDVGCPGNGWIMAEGVGNSPKLKPR